MAFESDYLVSYPSPYSFTQHYIVVLGPQQNVCL